MMHILRIISILLMLWRLLAHPQWGLMNALVMFQVGYVVYPAAIKVRSA
jgi:hypothetical protein